MKVGGAGQWSLRDLKLPEIFENSLCIRDSKGADSWGDMSMKDVNLSDASCFFERRKGSDTSCV